MGNFKYPSLGEEILRPKKTRGGEGHANEECVIDMQVVSTNVCRF